MFHVFLIIKHKKLIDPEDLFLERFENVEFEGSGGIGPLKLFELISIINIIRL